MCPTDSPPVPIDASDRFFEMAGWFCETAGAPVSYHLAPRKARMGRCFASATVVPLVRIVLLSCYADA